MSDAEQSPKSRGAMPFSSDLVSYFSSQRTPFKDDGLLLNESALTVTPSLMEKQPTALDLIQADVILDPATPLTPQHKHAEAQMLGGPAAQVLKRHMDAVVKVYCTHNKPNFELPWQTRQQTTSKSTGFAVLGVNGEKVVLTNAHSVTYASQVQLKRRADDERFQARVVAVGTECDVALLSVEDDDFWRDIMPLSLSSDLPELQESLCVLGYPIGGDSLAISAGVVSRVQMTHYSFGCMSLLALQTDAAINSGNSGGPVLNVLGHCVGIAFQSLTGDVQSIGYVIPTSVCWHFLEDVHRHGRYTGFPSLNVRWQEMESKSLKRSYGLGPHDKGILVRSVVDAAPEAEWLCADDIIKEIDGVEVGNDGTIPFRHGERVDFSFLVTQRFVEDEMELKIIRDGKEAAVKIKLQLYQHLIPPHIAESKPSYFMVGGLVFTACSDPYLVQRYGSLGASPVRLMAKTYFGAKVRSEEQVVVLSNILVSPATVGYDSTLGLRDSAVVAFNGTKVSNLVQLAGLVTKCRDDFLRFDMEAGGKVIVLDSEAARKCTEQCIDQHNMRAAMSRDIEDCLDHADDVHE